MNKEIKRYIISFDYSLLDTIDLVLAKTNVIQKSFSNSVNYLIEVNADEATSLIKLIYTISSGQINVKDVTPKDETPAEPGTDKPLGSKSAIDEN